MNAVTSNEPTATELNHEMIVKLHEQYTYDHIIALREASKIQRELTRAEHEAGRIARHLSRIEAFCKQHNIVLEEQ